MTSYHPLSKINDEFNAIIELHLESCVSGYDYIPREYNTIEWMRDNILSPGENEDWMDEDWYKDIKDDWGTTSFNILLHIEQRRLE